MQNARNKYIPLFLALFTLSYSSANLYAAKNMTQTQPSTQKKTNDEEIKSKKKLVILLNEQLKLKESKRNIPKMELYSKTLFRRISLIHDKAEKIDFLRACSQIFPKVYEYIRKQHQDRIQYPIYYTDTETDQRRRFLVSNPNTEIPPITLGLIQRLNEQLEQEKAKRDTQAIKLYAKTLFTLIQQINNEVEKISFLRNCFNKYPKAYEYIRKQHQDRIQYPIFAYTDTETGQQRGFLVFNPNTEIPPITFLTECERRGYPPIFDSLEECEQRRLSDSLMDIV